MAESPELEEEPEYDDPEPRLPRGYLETDVDRVCRGVHTKELTLPEGKYLTPYQVGTFLIAETDGGRKRPSTGAISNIFSKMEKAGYANFRVNPRAFVELTMEGYVMGSWLVYIDNFKEKLSDNGD